MTDPSDDLAPPAPLAFAGQPAPDLEPVADRAGRRRRLAVLGLGAVAVLGAVLGIEAVWGGGRPGSPPGSWTLVPHRGLGAWVDVYDWTEELGGPRPAVGPADIDAMAEAGIQTLYVQTSHERSAADVIEPERLDELIDRAHDNDLHVVGWYLPTFVDVERDLRRLVAASELRIDGLGVDIESTTVVDPVERNRRLLDLTARLRDEVGEDKVLAAITLSAVHVQVVNPDFWPGYPWPELGDAYDAVLPMAYWSIRRGELQAGERYIGENIERIRASTGRDDVPIHVIGGIADGITVADVEDMAAAIIDRGGIGGSLYDWNTSSAEQWEALQVLRDENR